MRYLQKVSLICVCSISLVGCSKKEAADSGPALPVAAGKSGGSGGAELIPGEHELQAAMNEKNYPVAVDRLFGMKNLLVTPEQRDRWAQLFGDMRSKLTDESDKDPKAAEALMTLRATRNGR